MSAVALLAALKGLAATFSDCPIFWPNEIISRPTNDAGMPEPFVWAEITGLNSEITSMGAPGQNWLKDDGFVRLHIMVPFGAALETPYAIADTLAGLFRIASPIDGLQTFAPTKPEPGAESDDGLYYGVSISVPYTYRYQG